MSERNNATNRVDEEVETMPDGPIMVNSFSKTFMRDGVPADVPEVLKDPRAEDYMTRMFKAFEEAMTLEKRSSIVDTVRSGVSRLIGRK